MGGEMYEYIAFLRVSHSITEWFAHLNFLLYNVSNYNLGKRVCFSFFCVKSVPSDFKL